MNNSNPVLLVEDDSIDAMTVKRAFKELKIPNRLIVLKNGEEAITYLHKPDSEWPCIILLDLNMPKMGGLEFLTYLKNDPLLKRIPVVVMTTSQSDEDKLESYNLGIAGYMHKTLNYKEFVEVIRTTEKYWTTSELPPDGV